MNNLLLYKTTIVQLLIGMFADEGIVITTAATIDIEKILVNTDIEKYKNLSELKYFLSPIICRNKEDQDKVYKVFDKLDEKLRVYQPPKPEPEPGPKPEPDEKRENLWEKIKSKWYLKKVLLPSVIIVALLLLLYFFRDQIIPPPQPPQKKISINVSPAKFALINDTVLFTAIVDSNLKQKNTSVDWIFPDTMIRNRLSYSRIITGTTIIPVTAFLKDENGAPIDSSNYYLQPVCEIPPSVSINETGGISANGAKAVERKRFTPIFFNDTTDKRKYSYKWMVDDTLGSTNEVFTYSKPYNIVKLIVGCNGLHCSTDSMIAQVESVPALNATITGDHNLKIQSTYNWKNILISLLFLLFIPGIISSLILLIIWSVRYYIPKQRPYEAGTKGPYSIKFNGQQHNIETETGIRKFADILRKRQVSNIFKLNLRKTIRSTAIANGIPKLEFVPLSKPMSFLVFIDTEKPRSFLVKLFEYLAEKLRKEEVDIVVYKYFKEPLFLSNEKLNQERIPLEKVAALYPYSTLFIFGDAQYFLYPYQGLLKDWVMPKLNSWTVRFLITPFSNKDWDKKENLLIESNFVVLSADLSSLPVIEKIISGQIDIRDQNKEHIDTGYRSRFLDLQDFKELKDYLGEGAMLQWVCSLAIYPAVDWDLTIAIGKAIEERLQQNGVRTALVNYTNLLKIARISWTQDGIVNESLRSQMLTYLDGEAETLAREILSRELQLIEGKIHDNSLIKGNFDLHNKLNRFLTDSFRQREIDKQDELFVKTSLQLNRLDEGQSIYFKEGNGLFFPHPLKKGKRVGLGRYFKLKSGKQIINNLGYAFASLIALILTSFALLKNYTGYLNWSSVKPSLQSYYITSNASVSKKEFVLNLYYDPTHTKEINQNILLSDTVGSFRNYSTMIADTSTFGFLKISTIEGQTIVQDSFKLNSNVYNIKLQQAVKIPLEIYYRDPTALTIGNAIAENLPSRFSVDVQQRSFSDTALASVFYFPQGNREEALVVAGTINALLGINIQAKQTDSLAFPKSQGGVLIYINAPPSKCTPLMITALPQTLNEIWHGGTSNRLININLSRRVIYYSVNDTITYGTYSVEDICLTDSGSYKITTKTNQGYKLFFIRNVKYQSFELSVCQNFVQSKSELANKDESYCDRFNVMSWYYPKNASRIYLPISGNKLSTEEKRKLDLAPVGLNETKSTTVIGYWFTNYIKQLTDANIRQILSVNEFAYSADSIKNISISTTNPFQRNYLVVKFIRSAIKTATQYPDCSITFISLDEISKLKNPLIVCKLDLSKTGISTIPKELYSFTNMQELNLGTTTISQSEIDQLQKALPRCKITYTFYTAPSYSNNTMDLGYIYFEKNQINAESRSLLDRIGKVLVGNQKASIVLEGQYTSDQSVIDNYMKQVMNYFSKMGIRLNSGQINQSVTPTRGEPQKQQQQQQQQQKSSGGFAPNIHITGTNFPPGFNPPSINGYGSTPPIVGTWINEDTKTRGVPKFIISQDGVLKVHMYGACSPTDCDWGIVNLNNGLSANTYTALYTVSFETTNVQFTYANKKITIVTKTHFTDKSGRADYSKTETFVREQATGK